MADMDLFEAMLGARRRAAAAVEAIMVIFSVQQR